MGEDQVSPGAVLEEGDWTDGARSLEVTVSRPPTPPPVRHSELKAMESPSLSAAIAASTMQRKRADKLERENLEVRSVSSFIILSH